MRILDANRRQSSAPLVVVSLAAAQSCGCHLHSATPKYASWEPIGEAIPAVDASTALRRLEESRKYWEYASKHEHGSVNLVQKGKTLPVPRYTYVRARQLDEGQVRFTIIAVEGARVVARGLSEIAPRSLREYGLTRNPDLAVVPRELWREFNADVGRHHDGAPALVVSELYDQCEAEIRRDPTSPVRLYFHPSGILMQCGRLKSSCAECASVSIHAYAMESIVPWVSGYPVSHWACTEPWGLVLPGAVNWLRGWQHSCSPPDSTEYIDAKKKRPVHLNMVDPWPEPSEWPQSAVGAEYECFASAPSRPVGYLDVGKAEPGGLFWVWAARSGDCGHRGAEGNEFRMPIGFSSEHIGSLTK